MPFEDQFQDYKRYTDEDLYFRSVPPDLPPLLEGVFAKHARLGPEESCLKGVVNALLGAIPAPPTTNWSDNWLAVEMSDALRELVDSPFDQFMDGVMDAAGVIYQYDRSVVRSLNRAFHAQKLGYEISETAGRLRWKQRERPAIAPATLDELEEAARDVCAQALEHVLQARANSETDTERARKDAVRDALSAMESMLKNVTGASNVEKAVRQMKGQGHWGHAEVVGDASAIWSEIHRLYPDVRHGNPTPSSMSREEAGYWIDRISAYVRYISRRKREIERR